MMNEPFERYAIENCPWSKGQPSKTERLACWVNWTSTVRPDGFIKAEAILKSKLWMDKVRFRTDVSQVWSWDNCFNCLAIAVSDIKLGLEQLLLPFDFQTSDGMLPDSVTYAEIQWDFTKPPIFGWAMNLLLDLCPDLPDATLADIYTKVAAFTNFWLQHRRTKSSHLPWYCHGNDSGWDNCTWWDDDRLIVAADLAAHLAVQCDFLMNTARTLNNGDEAHWTSTRDQLAAALVEELWDGERCGCKNAFTGEFRTTATLLAYFPLTAHRFLSGDVVAKMVAGLERHLTDWGLATEAPDSPDYDPDGYWRGPIWAPSTLIIESAVRQAGYTTLAKTITDRFLHVCATSGFAENYNALTGAGNRDLSYTWSSSVYLFLAR